MENFTDFDITSITWHEVTHLVDPEPFILALNEHLHLEDYGTGVRNVFFAFIAQTDDGSFHPNRARYRAKTKTVEILWRLDYEEVFYSDEDEVREMMSDLFVNSIDLWRKWRISDFDVDRFQADVRRLFARMGWLKKAMEQVA